MDSKSGRSSSRASGRSSRDGSPVLDTSPLAPSKVERLTQKSGAPIGDKLNSLLLGAKGPNLMADMVYLEETAHFNRERIPERVVHAKGGAAYGQFIVTNTEVCKYTKAALFSQIGKKTPLVARFSHVAGESGIADTARDIRGFAVKFYTEQGNWDLVGNNFPVFFIRDPINFSSLIHSQKRNPKTHLKDPDAFWDFVAMAPESLHAITMLYSERGTPDGFRHMHGYGVNTFKLVNSRNEAFYAKFHWICNQKIRNLSAEVATKLAGSDPDYGLRDLYVNIEHGYHPSWTLKFQIMGFSEAELVEFNPFDATKTWPQARYPPIEIGKMTLNRNCENYFAQVEQLAFCPGNLIPGIEASPDKILVGRMFSYSDAQRYRLGANFADLPCNKAKCPIMTPTYCDGQSTYNFMSSSIPNYVPSNKFKNLKIYEEEFIEHKQPFSGHMGRFDLSHDDNYSQVRILVQRVLTREARDKLAQNIAGHLKYVVNKEIVAKILAHYSEIDTELSKAIEGALPAPKQQRTRSN